MIRATKVTEESSATPDSPSFRWRESLLVFLIALIVRIAYLIESSDNPTFLFPVIDAYAYDLLARKLASGLPPGNVLFWQPVLYPHFLAGMYALFSHEIWAAKVLQSAIGAATCMLTFWVGRFAFSHRVGLVAGMIMAFYGPVIFFETELLGAGLGLFWTVSLLLLFMLAPRSGSYLLFFVLGFCGVLATLTRPPLLVFFLTGCAVLATKLKKQMNWHELAVKVLLVGAGFGILASYVASVNHTRTGHFGILPSSGGINLYIGNNHRWQQTVTARPDRAWKEIVSLPNSQGIRDQWEQSQFFQREVIEYVRENPAAFIQGLLRKTSRFFNSREIPRNVDIYIFRKWSSVLSVLTWKIGPYGFPFGLIWPLAVFGFVTSRREVPYPLWVLVGTYPAVIILYFVSARYRILVVPCLAVMSAAGVVQIGSLILDRKWKRLVLSIALILGVSIASFLPAEFPEETASISYEAEMYRHIGRARLEEGEYDEAVHHLNKALMINPDFADALNDTGAALLGQEKHDEAIPYLERAGTLEPSVSLFQSNLGLAYLEKGDFSAAERHCRKAVELDPAFFPARLNLGISLLGQEKFDEAIEIFRQALRRNPNHHRARLLLQNAIQSRKKSVKSKPQSLSTGGRLRLRRNGRAAAEVTTQSAV